MATSLQFANTQKFYLIDNPVIVEFKGKKFIVLRGSDNALIYTGSSSTFFYFNNKFDSVDLTNILKPYVDQSGIFVAKIRLIDADDTIGVEETFTVFGGGISKQMIRNLATLNTDIFTEKLKNNDSNFILTTRTNSDNIFIPENELLPLKYYGSGFEYDVKADGVIIFSADHTADTEEKLYSINLAMLREQVAINSGKLISEFRFTKDGNFLFTVYLTEPKSFTKYALDFVNSWGVRERIAIQKDIDYIPETQESTKSQKYDPVINDFTRVDDRKAVTHKYAVNLGIRNPLDTMFLQDLFQSDQVYLIIDNKYEFPVFIKPDTNLLATTKGTPVEVTATVELKDTDANYCPLLTDASALYLTSENANITSQQSDIVV